MIAYATGYNITSYWESTVGTGNVARSNCVYGGGAGNVSGGFTSQNNLVADPQFVNRGARDYRLKAGSPCLASVGYDTAAKLG